MLQRHNVYVWSRRRRLRMQLAIFYFQIWNEESIIHERPLLQLNTTMDRHKSSTGTYTRGNEARLERAIFSLDDCYYQTWNVQFSNPPDWKATRNVNFRSQLSENKTSKRFFMLRSKLNTPFENLQKKFKPKMKTCLHTRA